MIPLVHETEELPGIAEYSFFYETWFGGSPVTCDVFGKNLVSRENHLKDDRGDTRRR